MFHDFCINIWYNTVKDHVTRSTELSVSLTHLVALSLFFCNNSVNFICFKTEIVYYTYVIENHISFTPKWEILTKCSFIKQ